jgi:ribonucleoside-diphosphate reductase alpha chain
LFKLQSYSYINLEKEIAMAIKPKVSQIRKRDGRIVKFEGKKITNAIHKAILSVKRKDGKSAQRLSDQVVTIIEERFGGKIPTVENVQDIVEETLIKNGYSDVAKAYILYRQKRTELRETKKLLGVTDDLKMALNAVRVLERRYLLKDDQGNVIETPSEMFRRVAKAVASADRLYRKDADVRETEGKFYRAMANLEFVPNSPTLMNAGTEIGQLSACFVLPVEDSIDAIFDALKSMAVIHKSGGGTGFSFSRLRPAGDLVKSTKGVASGPVSFMRIFDVATDVIKQGGKRRGANMGIMRVDHPDIIEFITAKEKEGILANFNVSVGVTDAFMKALKNDEEYHLINPRTGKAEKKLRARDVFDLIVTMAWRTGDPGIIFLDEINRHNPTPNVGKIESTNPCGEVPLLPYESCNLGSINLSKMVKNGKIDWDKLREAVRTAIHFLDNVIDVNNYPLPEIEKITKANRKIGLGVMGFAELLIELKIPYDSEEAIAKAEKVMKFIAEEARRKSTELAEERDSFPNFKGSIWEKKGYKRMRNATLTTIAPTGTISIIASASSGIEPLFAVSFVRNVMGTQLFEVNHIFERIARERGFYSMELLTLIAKSGSVKGIKEVPTDVQRLFLTALDVAPEWHVKMQAAFQKHTDNAVSKTVNLPQEATLEDVRKIFMLAYNLKCKGITVYRYGSKKEQVLYVGQTQSATVPSENYVTADSEYSGGCPSGVCPL